MLPKHHRLNIRKYPQFYKTFRRFSTPLFVMFYKKTNKNNYTKVGVIASKKEFSKAVERNRAKRRLRGIIYPLVKHKNGDILIFLLRRKFLQVETNNIIKAMERAIDSI